MNLSKKGFYQSAMIAAIIVAVSTVSYAGEHPAEHPTKQAAAPSVNPEDVARYIESYVSGQSQNGTYRIHDDKANKDLSLALEHVHRDRLSQIGPQTYFVCADFKTAAGKIYDLDFFVTGTSKRNLKTVAEKTTVHKEAGLARYTWHERDGIWVKQLAAVAGASGSKAEHPTEEAAGKEHPK